MSGLDVVQWYPMRVTYGRELSVKEFLDGEGIENFLPMTTRYRQDGKHVRHERVPAITNLIFVRASRRCINELKQTRLQAMPLRYMMRRPVPGEDAPTEIITVPDGQMESFMRIARGPEEQVSYLSADELKGKVGAEVVITSGPFEGVHGVVKRVHGNKRILVELEGIGGICINFVPRAQVNFV